VIYKESVDKSGRMNEYIRVNNDLPIEAFLIDDFAPDYSKIIYSKIDLVMSRRKEIYKESADKSGRMNEYINYDQTIEAFLKDGFAHIYLQT
jgi:hypothetical protein